MPNYRHQSSICKSKYSALSYFWNWNTYNQICFETAYLETKCKTQKVGQNLFILWATFPQKITVPQKVAKFPDTLPNVVTLKVRTFSTGLFWSKIVKVKKKVVHQQLFKKFLKGAENTFERKHGLHSWNVIFLGTYKLAQYARYAT